MSEKTEHVKRASCADLSVGDFVSDRYQLRDVLGTGGMAVVFRARDMRLRRDVAIKVLRRELRRQWRTVQRFSREGQAMAALDSPHVVPVYDVGQEQDRPFIVMKLIDAPTLADLIARDGALPEPRALAIVAGVLRGLVDLHGRGIVHRDVKPSNVVVEEGDRAMILDFGIVLDTSEPTLTAEGVVVGTPSYMSPEQLMDPSRVDGRSDLYSAGVLLFEALTGRPPFEGDTPTAVAMGHTTLPAPDVSRVARVSQRAASVVARALEKSPDDRFQHAEEMLEAIDGAEVSTPDDEQEQVEPPGRSMRFPLLLTSLFALVGGFLLLAPLLAPVSQPRIEATPLAPLPEAVPEPEVREPTNREAADAPAPERAEIPERIELAAPAVKRKVEKEAPPKQPAAKGPAAKGPAAKKPAAKQPAAKKPAAKRSARKRPRPEATSREAPLRAALPGRNPQVRRAQRSLASGDTREAIRLLNEVIREDPTLAEPYATLGDAYQLTGNEIAAIAAYRRYLALDSDGPGARRVEAALARLGGR